MENNSLRGRFSLSTTNLSPIAESTCLNGISTKFKWGEGFIGSRNRNNSLTSERYTSLTKNSNGTPTKVSMSPKPRIDPKTYVDIRSNGLASRIVEYHDNSARLNRSLSMGNLYNKPGQFPVVHLKKNELQYKATKNKNLSVAKIAPPEKSIYHANTLPGILRSSSLVSLQKSDEEISRENRPILHPPPTENDLAPTRSVLEVLKEISRKRINSDEHDGTELTKKHCKELESDGIPYTIQKIQSKRQREVNIPTSSGVQLSPEQQVVKKRLCNYNNEILSSLSSSMLSAKKRMLQMSSQNQYSSNTLSTTRSVPPDFDSERNRNSYLLHTMTVSPVTPLPNTPQVNCAKPVETEKCYEVSGQVTRFASDPVISSTKPKLTLFNVDYNEAPSNLPNDHPESHEDDGLSGIPFIKPKKSSSLSSNGAQLLEKIKKSRLAIMLSALKGELNEEDDEVDAPPKTQDKSILDATISSSSGASTSVALSSTTQAAISFKTTTTTATALAPAPDSANKITTESSLTVPPLVKGALQFKAPATTSSISSNHSNGFQLTTMTTASSKTLTATTSAPAVAKITPTPAVSNAPTLTGFSFGLSKPTTTNTSSLAAPQLNKSTEASAPNVAAPVVTAVSSTTTPTKPFSFGLPTTTVQAPASTAPTFTFGSPNTPSLSVAKTQAESNMPTFGSLVTTAAQKTETPLVFGQSTAITQPTFTFGAPVAANAEPSKPASTPIVAPTLPTAPAQATTTSAPPTFNFGAIKNAWNPQANNAAATTTNSNSMTLFGNINASTLASQSTAAPTTTTSSGGFSFSGTSAAKSLFSNMAPATTTSSNPSSTFSFPATQPSNMRTSEMNSVKIPPFGSTKSTPSTTSSIQSPVFGSVNPVKPSNSFTFGASAGSTAPTAQFTFSAAADKPIISTAPTANSVGGFSFNAPAADANKIIFSSPTQTVANSNPSNPAKPVFAFGSTASSPTTNEASSIFRSPTVKPANPFGAPATTTAQNSPFGFGASNTATNQGGTNTNLFGAASSHNPANGGPPNPAPSSNSIFGLPAATVAPLQQSTTFTFGASSNNNTKSEPAKPAGAFVFGSSSAIGSNASKPATDVNKTFVFGDGNTTITPSPAGTTNLFASSTTSNAGNGTNADNKVFSFGGANTTLAAGTNNTFGGIINNQAAGQSPVFNFGAASPTPAAPAQNGNLFSPQQSPGAAQLNPLFRPMRKAMRRLHKT